MKSPLELPTALPEQWRNRRQAARARPPGGSGKGRESTEGGPTNYNMISGYV